MLTLLLAAASLAPSGPSPLAPLGSLIKESDYPAGAMQAGTTGHVTFRLRVDASGKPDGCVVSQTSGSADLDNATCDLMLARARFKPALGASGEQVRGDYSAKIAWTLEDPPEAVTNEVIRVRSELDQTGRVTSCTATPVEPTAQFGCTLFGDPRMLGHLVGRPWPGFAWIETRLIKQASTDKPIADVVPTGAERNVIARSTMMITPAGTIGSCINNVVTQFDGRPLNLCVIGQAHPDAKFTAVAGSQFRQLTIILETVSQSRQPTAH